jgi:hypothetical protein
LNQMLAFFFKMTLPTTVAVGAIQYSSSSGNVGSTPPNLKAFIAAP